MCPCNTQVTRIRDVEEGEEEQLPRLQIRIAYGRKALKPMSSNANMTMA